MSQISQNSVVAESVVEMPTPLAESTVSVTVSVPETVSWTLGPEEHEDILMSTGFLTLWMNDKDLQVAKTGSQGPRDLARGLLAAVDELRIQSTKDQTLGPVLCFLARSPYLRLARQIITMDPNPLTDSHHRVTVDRLSFNPRIHATREESEAPIGKASVWTLIKSLDQQIRAGVNRCYRWHLEDLPILSPPIQTGNKNQGKGKKTKSGNKQTNPTSRCPEEGIWNGVGSAELCSVLYEISEPFNRMLRCVPDMREAYVTQGQLRRDAAQQQRLREIEARNAAYEARNAEHQRRRDERAERAADLAKQQADEKAAEKAAGKLLFRAKRAYVNKQRPDTEGFVRVQPKFVVKTTTKAQAQTQGATP